MAVSWTDMAGVIPTGISGNAEIKHENLEGIDLAVLYLDDIQMFADSRQLRGMNEEVVEAASGDVLIGGLGIGMILIPICAKEEVTSVKVIENNAGVIALVESYVQHDKLTVVEGNIFTWTPGEEESWDTIWFDIWWGDSYATRATDIETLQIKYQSYLNEDGWMRGWLE